LLIWIGFGTKTGPDFILKLEVLTRFSIVYIEEFVLTGTPKPYLYLVKTHDNFSCATVACTRNPNYLGDGDWEECGS
jgi:hypothetical protein